MSKATSDYEFKTAHSMKEAQKLMKQGWELADSSGRESWVWGSNYKAIMRRPKKTPETVNYSNAIDYSTVDPNDKSLTFTQRRYARKVARVAADRAAKKAAADTPAGSQGDEA